MRKLLLAALLAVALTAWSAPQAEAHGGGCINLHGGFRLKICYAGFLNVGCEPFSCHPCGGHGGGGGGGGMAPWYLYWPMEAHYQVPAPTGYPYWPSAMTPPTTWGYTPAPPAVHPAGYSGVPSYWYGH